VLVAGGAAAYLLRPAAPKTAPAASPAAETIAIPITIQMKPRAVAEAPAVDAAPTSLPAPVLLAEPTPEPEEPKAPAVARVEEQATAAAKRPAAPSSPKALLAQADRVRQRGDAERALDLYGRLVASDPENAAALAGRGLCYLDLEQYAPAEASFQAALRATPGFPDALMGLAETYRGRGRKGEALQYYEQYLALHPDGEEAAVARNAIEELRR
jgi:tetratricopeptide (TPR) repeat protein